MQEDPGFPFTSIILPVRNEAAYIRRSLGSVLVQDYPEGRLEVLVVDGMSSDGTRELVHSLAHLARHPVRIIDNAGLITAAALNIGIRQATGEIVVRVDGHCEIATDYVRRCVTHLTGDSADAVGGAMETIGLTGTASTIAIAMSTPFGVGNSAFRTTRTVTVFTDTVPFPAYTRKTLLRVGSYDENMACNEDDEYNYRLVELGGKILLADDVRSRYYSRSTFPLLWQQYFRYGHWKVRVFQKHPKQMRLRHFVPTVLVGGLLVTLLLGAFSPVFVKVFWLLACGYLIANVFVSAITAGQKGLRHLPLLPVAFAILHFAYGAGFLFGLARFANLWRAKPATPSAEEDQGA